MRPPRLSSASFSSEAGFSLTEDLVTVAIIALGIVLLIAMISTGTIGVSTANTEVTAENLARSQLEMVKNAPYQPDPTAIPYPSMSAPSRYEIVTAVEYWTAPSGPFVPAVRNDGLQRVTVSVNHDGVPVLQLEAYKVER
jgi:hypothetical protein